MVGVFVRQLLPSQIELVCIPALLIKASPLFPETKPQQNVLFGIICHKAAISPVINSCEFGGIC